MKRNASNQSDSIQECLDDICLGSVETVALPGFCHEEVCLLCKLQITDDDKDDACENRVERGGASLMELMRHAERQFNDTKGTPLMTVAKDVHTALQHYISADGDRLGFLRDVSPTNVYDHFFYDHSGKHPPNTKERVERILLSMLNVGIQSCCNKLDNGKTSLIRDEAVIILQIVDRLTKISASRGMAS